jgi:serine/threonine protein kinase
MSQPFDPTENWPPGSVIPGTVYRVVRLLGRGGMGEVFEVEHNLLGARRALKVLPRHYAGRDDLAERLRVEARGLARLKHPNLVEVYDLGVATDHGIFFAMELLEGTTMRELFAHRGKLSPALAGALVAQALDGLHAAHGAGMVHRDVKPENVFVCRGGTVKLLDFGIAKNIDAWRPAQQITAAGMTVGTPRYMSPEQAEGKHVDARTDVYAAGLVLWEAVCGRPAFDETDAMALVTARLVRGVPALPAGVARTLPSALLEAIARACAIDPAARFASAEAFAIAIRAALDAGAAAERAPERTLPDLAAGGAPIARPPPVASRPGQPPGDRTVVDLSPIASAAPDTAEGLTRTVPMPDDLMLELTERIDSAVGVSRDASTRAGADAVDAPLGPSGTAVLPSVAARHAAGERLEAGPVASPRDPSASPAESPGPGPAASPVSSTSQPVVRTPHGDEPQRGRRSSNGVRALAVALPVAAVVAASGWLAVRLLAPAGEPATAPSSTPGPTASALVPRDLAGPQPCPRSAPSGSSASGPSTGSPDGGLASWTAAASPPAADIAAPARSRQPAAARSGPKTGPAAGASPGMPASGL